MGVLGNTIAQPVFLFKILANFLNHVFLNDEIQYNSPGLPFFKIVKIPDITSSIKDQTISDVPVGVYFSGGIDSSIIAYTLKDMYNVFGYMAFSFAAAHKTDPLLNEIKVTSVSVSSAVSID